MKRIIVVLFLLLASGRVDISAQNFLKNLENTLKKEVVDQVKNAVDKGIDKGIEALKNKQKEKNAEKSAEKPAQETEKKAPASSNVTAGTGTPITKMETWLLVIKDGKPHYKFIDSSTSSKANYYLDDIKYEHPDGVKPFTFTTAVATFKAKDGYYFDKSLKLNEETTHAENTTGFKRIDARTVKVYLTAFTGDMGYDVRITPEMIEYKKKVSEMNITPIATAQFNAPLFDHWSQRLRWGDNLVNGFVEKNMRSYYQYPTTEQLRTSEGTIVNDGKKTNYPKNYTILSIDVLDDDLSDNIPGLVGEWCLIEKNKFIPKACLKDIKYGAKHDGAPAEIIHSAFEFAGGSGTLEDPYLIKTAEQLNAVRQGPKNHYKLIADIDLSNWGNWIPIGGTDAYGFMDRWDKAEKGAYSFQGSFDGNGHVVSGMQIVINEETPFLTEGTTWRAYGLFGSLATNPVEYKIKNLGVVNFNIDVNYTNLKREVNLYAAAICGGMNNGTDIINCYSKGGRININVIGNEAFKPQQYGFIPDGAPNVNIHVGGICSTGGGVFGGQGNVRKGLLHIEKCFNDSELIINAVNCSMNIYVGGIIGSMDTTHIHECYNSGNITAPLQLEDLVGSPDQSMAAGICAYASIPEIPGIYHKPPEGSSYILDCYNSGQIISRSAAGIFHLSLSDIHLENCYNTGLVLGNEFDNSNAQPVQSLIFSKSCAIYKYGTEFVRNCTGNGNAVTGSAWITSSDLGRKVLAAIPEDDHPSKVYEVAPIKVGLFTDVNLNAWYGKAVQWALDNKVISDASNKFSPDKKCTRADFYTFLWNASGAPKMSDTNPFTDVKSTDSYYDAALWAKGKGLISGATFGPQTSLTRAEFVIALWKDKGCPEGLQANQYLDIESHQSDFGKAVAWSHANAVMGGTGEYKFSPKATCTRADVIEIMYRANK